MNSEDYPQPEWRAITEAPKENHRVLLLKSAEGFREIAYWGAVDDLRDFEGAKIVYSDPANQPLAWRDATDTGLGLPITFEPVAFALIDESMPAAWMEE